MSKTEQGKSMPLTLFHENLLQRYMFQLMTFSTGKQKNRLIELDFYPSDINCVIPECEYYNTPLPKKKLQYTHSGKVVEEKMYKPDFVIYERKTSPRDGPLSGDAAFVEVKWSLEHHTFDLHQWMGLLDNGRSIVASFSDENVWKHKLKESVNAIKVKYPFLSKHKMIEDYENRIEYFQICFDDFTTWCMTEIAGLLSSQTSKFVPGNKRYWLCILTNTDSTTSNWDRMIKATDKSKKRWWAWARDKRKKKKSRLLSSLYTIRSGDEIMFIRATPDSARDKGGGRWGNASNSVVQSDEVLAKWNYTISAMYCFKATDDRNTTNKPRTPYRLMLGNDPKRDIRINFFEYCSNGKDNCIGLGCSGCGDKGRILSMNEINWPHFITMEEIEDQRRDNGTEYTEQRGALSSRIGYAGDSPRPPVELTKDEFLGLKSRLLNNL
jgi:hypothetical protein